MSDVNTSTSATLQSIIIAFVAGGILTIGLVAIFYRRRQKQRLLRASQSGMRMIVLPDGRVFTVSPGGGTVMDTDQARSLGSEPLFWDVQLGSMTGQPSIVNENMEREWIDEKQVQMEWKVCENS